MIKKKLRGYVMPTLYVIILMLIFGTVSLISTMFKSNPDYLYSIGIIKNINALPVVGMDEATTKAIIKPYIGDGVVIDKYFYDSKSDPEKQEKSLIYYQNTYMKNTGLLYKADNKFQAAASLDGTIVNIKTDDVLGNVIEISHKENLRTIYYGLNDIKVKVGDAVEQGQVIGDSGSNKISENANIMLFEVTLNGTLINPEDYFNMDPTSLD